MICIQKNSYGIDISYHAIVIVIKMYEKYYCNYNSVILLILISASDST